MAAANAEANGQPLAAARLRHHAAKQGGPGHYTCRLEQVEEAVGSQGRRHSKSSVPKQSARELFHHVWSHILGIIGPNAAIVGERT